jgi:putative methyltransferase (TIGR04325 family)
MRPKPDVIEEGKSLLGQVSKIAQLVLPPIVTEGVRHVLRRHRMGVLEYVPGGWKAIRKDCGRSGWNSESVIEAEEARFDAFRRNLQGTGPLGFSHEHTDLSVIRDIPFHNVHITYAYVLALAAHKKDSLSVLDWGGGLGHYYLLGRAVVPDVRLDFHCKEVPSLAEAGKRLNPEVHWYADDKCLEKTYDLVLINGSLQYIEDWADTIRRISAAVKDYLFLTRVPVIEEIPSFLAIQKAYNTMMLHQQLNQSDVLRVVKETGLLLIREFVVGDGPYVRNAPEQCEMRGWLFRRKPRHSSENE